MHFQTLHSMVQVQPPFCSLGPVWLRSFSSHETRLPNTNASVMCEDITLPNYRWISFNLYPPSCLQHNCHPCPSNQSISFRTCRWQQKDCLQERAITMLPISCGRMRRSSRKYYTTGHPGSGPFTWPSFQNPSRLSLSHHGNGIMEPKWWALFGQVWSNLICFVKGFMITSIGMAVAHGHDVSYDMFFYYYSHPGQFSLPPFLQSCLRSEPLHPQERICRDSVRLAYDFPWWITHITILTTHWH